jgi:hypothetical protein
MKNLKNSLFKKFEQNKITNLAKVVGGVIIGTCWTGPNNTSGGDEACDDYTKNTEVIGFGKADIICMDTNPCSCSCK